MGGGISRRFFLGGAVSAVANVVFADAPERSIRPKPRDPERIAAVAREVRRQSAPAIADLVDEARLGGLVGFIVADARTGDVLESLMPDELLPPASVAKSVTALYAMTALGEGFRFQTRLIATGPITEGRLDGDLVLEGSGDPELDTDDLAEIAAKLKAAGLREVTGRFRVYAGALPYIRSIDPEQPDHVGYNPAISGVNLNFNRVHFQWQRASTGWAVSMDARSDTLRPAVSVAKMAVVNRDLPVYTYRDAMGVDEWTVASQALGNGGSRWLPVRRPDLYAGEVLQVLAGAQGIRLPDAEITGTRPSGTAIVTHDSDSLSEMTRLMLRYSTNITAEVLGLTASRKGGAPVDSLQASARAMSDWMRATMGAKDAVFLDHSGLSGESRVSARDLCKMLVAVGPAGSLHAHLKEVPVWDDQSKPLIGAPYQIHAKTGTLNFVSALAGYVTPDVGPPLAFAIFTADVERRAQIPPEEMERPNGASAWAQRARLLQQKLIRRWAAVYSV
jgi:D-alanyl-D-alanine carboxypeptidase/D-alanyl-D-alanine-endopeptidase (penicillin-binding protein 4)